MRLSIVRKAELDGMIQTQQRIVSTLRRAGATDLAQAAGDVLQRLLVWQQSCDVEG